MKMKYYHTVKYANKWNNNAMSLELLKIDQFKALKTTLPLNTFQSFVFHN